MTARPALAALAAGEPRRHRAPTTAGRSSTRSRPPTRCILLWMAGGMAAPETFDPKRYTPFEVGVPVEKILCTFPAIDTAVDGIKISAGLENVAKVMDRGTLIRSHVVADLGNILHSRHQYHWHTGYVPPQTVAAPAHRLVDRQGPRAEEPGDPGVHQHRPAARGASASRRSSRRSPPAASSAASTARSTCPSRTTPPPPSARRRG